VQILHDTGRPDALSSVARGCGGQVTGGDKLEGVTGVLGWSALRAANTIL
jgi:hypothetical protein